jgi:hypothetical protein
MTISVQLPCNWRVTSVSAGSCLHLTKLHAYTRAARLVRVIGSWQSWTRNSWAVIKLGRLNIVVTAGRLMISAGIFRRITGLRYTLPKLSFGPTLTPTLLRHQISMSQINGLGAKCSWMLGVGVGQ